MVESAIENISLSASLVGLCGSSMKHRRTDEAIERRKAKRQDRVNHTLRDHELAETVCTLKFKHTLTYQCPKTGDLIHEPITINPGRIIADSRGRGILQRIFLLGR